MSDTKPELLYVAPELLDELVQHFRPQTYTPGQTTPEEVAFQKGQEAVIAHIAELVERYRAREMGREPVAGISIRDLWLSTSRGGS